MNHADDNIRTVSRPTCNCVLGSPLILPWSVCASVSSKSDLPLQADSQILFQIYSFLANCLHSGFIFRGTAADIDDDDR